MPAFTVTSIIDGDTFEVSPQWKWNSQTGNRVHPAEYDAAELHALGGQIARDRLSKLVHGEKVDILNAQRIDRGRLVCEVYFRNMNLADLFAEYREPL